MSIIGYRKKRGVKTFLKILLIVVLSFYALEYYALVTFFEKALKEIISLNLDIGRIRINPYRVSIKMWDLKIFNPEGFGNKVLVDVPFLIMDMKAKTFFQRGIFFNEIHIKIKEVGIIKDKNNVINLSRLKILAPPDGKIKKPVKTKRKGSPFLIDRYVIEIDNIRYIDYSKEDGADEKLININVKEEYKNVKDAGNIARVIIYKIFFTGRLGNIGIDLGRIKKGLLKMSEENENLGKELSFMTRQKLKATQVILEEKVGDVKENINKANEAIREKLDGMTEHIDRLKER